MPQNQNDKYLNLINSLSLDLDKCIQFINDIENFSLQINEKGEVDVNDLVQCLKYLSFLTSTHLDLLVISNSFSKSKTQWEKTYYSKQGYLSIYETIKTYHKYQNKFINIKIIPEIDNDFKEVSNLLKKFKSKYNYDKRIANIRNKVAGHHDSNFDIYQESLKKINTDEIPELISEFLKFQTSLIKSIELVFSKI